MISYLGIIKLKYQEKNLFKTKFEGVLKVGGIGFEPTTSALSRRRSKPTELTALFTSANIRLKRQFCNILISNYVNLF